MFLLILSLTRTHVLPGESQNNFVIVQQNARVAPRSHAAGSESSQLHPQKQPGISREIRGLSTLTDGFAF